MNRLLVVLIVLVVGIIGLGFYQGWFKYESDKRDPNANVKLSYDDDKFKADTAKAQERLQPNVTYREKPTEPARQP